VKVYFNFVMKSKSKLSSKFPGSFKIDLSSKFPGSFKIDLISEYM
jgi:hypothetical protein